VDALASGPGPVLSKIKSGALHALAMSGTGGCRAARGSDVQELGLDVEYYQQVGIVARKETPAPGSGCCAKRRTGGEGREFQAAMAISDDRVLSRRERLPGCLGKGRKGDRPGSPANREVDRMTRTDRLPPRSGCSLGTRDYVKGKCRWNWD